MTHPRGLRRARKEVGVRAYIVRGDCGDYSSFQTWEVRAFADEVRALELCDQLNRWCIEHGCHRGLFEKDPRHNNPYPESCPLDPQFNTDYSGTRYEVWSIEVEP